MCSGFTAADLSTRLLWSVGNAEVGPSSRDSSCICFLHGGGVGSQVVLTNRILNCLKILYRLLIFYTPNMLSCQKTPYKANIRYKHLLSRHPHQRPAPPRQKAAAEHPLSHQLPPLPLQPSLSPPAALGQAVPP